MANPSERSFRVIDTTHLAAVAVLEAEIGAGNELLNVRNWPKADPENWSFARVKASALEKSGH